MQNLTQSAYIFTKTGTNSHCAGRNGAALELEPPGQRTLQFVYHICITFCITFVSFTVSLSVSHFVSLEVSVTGTEIGASTQDANKS